MCEDDIVLLFTERTIHLDQLLGSQYRRQHCPFVSIPQKTIVEAVNFDFIARIVSS